MKKILSLALLVALSACSTPKTSITNAIPDIPLGKTWVADWKQTSTISIARAGSALLADNDTLYLIAGVDGKDFLNTTEYAKIQKDGSLGPWQAGPSLNEARGFIDAVIHDGSIYVVGGGNGPNGHNLLRTAERAHILPDGTLGPWVKEKNEMVVTRRCSKIIATKTSIFSFGGYGGTLLDSVERADFMPDGSLGEWQLEKKTMLMPRYVNGVKKWGSSAYVIGGHDADKGVGITDVEWSPLGAEDKRDWKATSPLQVGRYGLSTVAHGNYMYALGGLTGLEFLDSVEKSKVNADGTLSAWQMSTPLNVARGMFSVVEYKDHIYVIGGSNRKAYLDTVEYAAVNQDGDFGYWGDKADAKAHDDKLEARKHVQSNLPNEGKVKTVLQAQMYTYIEVVTPQLSSQWLAGPKLDLQIGQKIRYSSGVVMSGFLSKELQRTFEEILFVGQVEKAE
jgi:starvation-inducible outer membrane lipoprotein